jgi:Ca2+-binding EF-hand superfamily protein
MPEERFKRLDRNGDGALSPADKPAGRPRKSGNHKAMIEKLHGADTDGDGKVTYEEVTAAKPGFPREAFDRADRNGDGVLSQDDAPTVD